MYRVDAQKVPTPARPGALVPTSSSAAFQFVVTVFVLVKNCTPALPYLQVICHSHSSSTTANSVLWHKGTCSSGLLDHLCEHILALQSVPDMRLGPLGPKQHAECHRHDWTCDMPQCHNNICLQCLPYCVPATHEKASSFFSVATNSLHVPVV